jgi:hypothetical protein
MMFVDWKKMMMFADGLLFLFSENRPGEGFDDDDMAKDASISALLK